MYLGGPSLRRLPGLLRLMCGPRLPFGSLSVRPGPAVRCAHKRPPFAIPAAEPRDTLCRISFFCVEACVFLPPPVVSWCWTSNRMMAGDRSDTSLPFPCVVVNFPSLRLPPRYFIFSVPPLPATPLVLAMATPQSFFNLSSVSSSSFFVCMFFFFSLPEHLAIPNGCLPPNFGSSTSKAPYFQQATVDVPLPLSAAPNLDRKLPPA